MLGINEDKCKKCKICMQNCPIGAIKATVENGHKKMSITAACVECLICKRVCPFDAIDGRGSAAAAIQCSSCPVQCKIPEGSTGACKRYTNEGGTLVRNRRLEIQAKQIVQADARNLRPIITAVGAGTNYPCCRPAPHIVSECRGGVDVVTVVTEAPLSYSGLIIKLDTNTYIGEEGATLYRGNKPVGMVNTEEYGSKMLAVGGANRMTGDAGFVVARTITELANGEEVELTVDKKNKLKLQQGKALAVNGVRENLMRIGCGSATVGLFAALMKECVDECIVIDHHVTGLFTEHLAGEAVGMSWSGVVPNAVKSSRGRYFGGHGDGIGGTVLKTPKEAIKSVDMSIARAGMKILVVNTTGEIYELFEVQENGSVKSVPMTEKEMKIPLEIQKNCEHSRVSVLYTGGVGGSARGGVCRRPLGITEAVHSKKAVLTIGGAPAFVYPGGGINFIVDTEKVVNKGFTWIPTPATVAPVEYTMKKTDYEAMGGHMEQIKDVKEYKG